MPLRWVGRVTRLRGLPRRLTRLRKLPARLPLRIRLVAVLLVLLTAGLLAIAVTANTQLRGYLLRRTDGQLVAFSHLVTRRIDRGLGFTDRVGPAHFQLPSDFYVAVSGPTGRSSTVLRAPLRAGQGPPRLPALDRAEVARLGRRPFTVAAVGGGGQRWRVLVTGLPGGTGAVTVAVSLDTISATLGRLAAIDAIVGVVALALLAGLGYAAVRSSLRPLTEVEITAEAIAGGDLSRRVPVAPASTEVGRLARALNGMLAQIEAAFRARADSERAARASQDRMRRFVADASHELRTPLTSIRGFAELYRQGAVSDPAELTRLLRRIEDEAVRMGLLVEDLLALARLDQQRPLARHPVDLLALAADAVQDARTLAPDRRISLEVGPGPGPSAGGDPDPGPGAGVSDAPIVSGDADRLRQVMSNLMSNALTHTPAGTPVSVRVSTSREPGAAGWAQVEVADAGPGLTPDQADRVFERFYRVDPARSRAHGGTGLGLSIAAAIVAAHGGRLGVTTAPGRGATFRMLLPLRDPAERTEGGRAAEAWAWANPDVDGPALAGSSQPPPSRSPASGAGLEERGAPPAGPGPHVGSPVGTLSTAEPPEADQITPDAPTAPETPVPPPTSA